jgi:hypothetical protein
MTERSLDTFLQLVADRRRRQAIHHLRHEADGKVTFDDLVDRLHNDESDADDHPTDRQQLAIQLYHAHLSKLADYGVVKFDSETGLSDIGLTTSLRRYWIHCPTNGH